MKIQTTGIVKKVYKDPIDGWCIAIQTYLGRSTYIKIPKKPKAKPGQKVKAGETI